MSGSIGLEGSSWQMVDVFIGVVLAMEAGDFGGRRSEDISRWSVHCSLLWRHVLLRGCKVSSAIGNSTAMQ